MLLQLYRIVYICGKWNVPETSEIGKTGNHIGNHKVACYVCVDPTEGYWKLHVYSRLVFKG